MAMLTARSVRYDPLPLQLLPVQALRHLPASRAENRAADDSRVSAIGRLPVREFLDPRFRPDSPRHPSASPTAGRI